MTARNSTGARRAASRNAHPSRAMSAPPAPTAEASVIKGAAGDERGERVDAARSALFQITQIFYGLLDLSDRNMVESELQQIEPALMKAIALRGRDLSLAAEELLKDEQVNVRELSSHIAGAPPGDIEMLAVAMGEYSSDGL